MTAAPPVGAQPRKVETAPARTDTPAPQAFPAPVLEPEKKYAAPSGLAGATDSVQPRAKTELDEQVLDRKRDHGAQTTAEKPALKAPEARILAPAAEPVTAAAPPPPVREEPVPAQLQLRSEPAAQAPAASGATAESALAAPAAKAARMTPARSKDPNARLYPEHWLANIRTMLREDKRDEALRSLDEFRKIYPDYHLPDDLRGLK
jgi:hypothetical protein